MPHRSSGAGTSGTGTSAVVPCPTVEINDIVEVAIYIENATDATAVFNSGAAAGFVVKDDTGVTNGATRGRLIVFWKRATAADAGTYTFSWTTSSIYEASARSFSGIVQSGDPYSITATFLSATSGATSVVPGAQSPDHQGDSSLWVTSHATNSVFAPATNYTERYEAPSGAHHLHGSTWDNQRLTEHNPSTTWTGTTGSSFPRVWIGVLITAPLRTVRVTQVQRLNGAPVGTGSFTPTMPTHQGPQHNQGPDRIRLVVTGKYITATTPSISAGWSLVGRFDGSAVGLEMFMIVWEKDAVTNADAAPTVTAGATPPNTWVWSMTSFRPATDRTWADPAGTGSQLLVAEDLTTGTGTSAVMPSNFTNPPTTEDALQLAGGTVGAFSAGTWVISFSASGLSGGTPIDSNAKQTTTLGDDVSIMMGAWVGFLGTESGALTVTWSHASTAGNAGIGLLAGITLRQTPHKASWGVNLEAA